MKIMTKLCVLVLAIAWLQVGCHNASLTEPSTITDGASGDDSGETTIVDDVTLDSFVDETGASLEGATVSVDKTLIMNFSGDLSNLMVSVRCDGKLHDIVIEQLSATSVAVSPEGEWPQLSTCVMSMNTAANIFTEKAAEDAGTFVQRTFYTACSKDDDFSNDKVIDPAATLSDAGAGCWATNLNTNPVAEFDFLVDDPLDVLMISMGDVEGEPGIDVLPILTKKLEGDYIEVNLKASDFGYIYEEADGWGANYGLLVANQPLDESMTEQPHIFTVLYHVAWNAVEGRLDYSCRGGYDVFDPEEGDLFFQSSVPAIVSIVRKGSVFSARCKINEDDAWGHPNPAQEDLGEAWTGPLYVSIVFFSKNAYIHFDDFEVIGGELGAW